MFETIYNIAVNEIQAKQIRNEMEIKKKFAKKTRDFFECRFPNYEKYLGNMEGLISKISESMPDVNGIDAYTFISNELDSCVHKWRSYLDVNTFIDVYSDVMLKKYNKTNKDKYGIDDAVVEALKRQKELGKQINSREDAESLITELFNQLFDKNENKYFTSQDYGKGNNARNYVSNKTKEELLQEMMVTAKLQTPISPLKLETSIRKSYAKNLSYLLFKNEINIDNTYDEDTFNKQMFDRIKNANLNEKQKQYLFEKLNEGNLEELLTFRIVTQEEVQMFYDFINSKEKERTY